MFSLVVLFMGLSNCLYVVKLMMVLGVRGNDLAIPKITRNRVITLFAVMQIVAAFIEKF